MQETTRKVSNFLILLVCQVFSHKNEYFYWNIYQNLVTYFKSALKKRFKRLDLNEIIDLKKNQMDLSSHPEHMLRCLFSNLI
jgi:hypothetical protein